MEITLQAKAKINLFLDITGTRPDGYHDISTIMHTVSLSDTVSVSFMDKPGINITTNRPYIPTDERNIAFRTAKAVIERLSTNQGLSIKLTKHIPVGGGLGGSSTDGSAVLKALNMLFGMPFGDEELLKIASSLSADMPFCLTGGAALCEGIGEKITLLPSLKKCWAVIVKPPFSLNTKNMYAAYDLSPHKEEKKADGIIAAIKEGNIRAVADNLYNAFDPIATDIKPQIAQYKKALLEKGALAALMTGSGSCVYGLYDNEGAAHSAAQKLKSEKMFTYCVKLV